MGGISVGGHMLPMGRHHPQPLQQDVFAPVAHNTHTRLAVDGHVLQGHTPGLLDQDGRAEVEGVPDAEHLPGQVGIRHVPHGQAVSLAAQVLPPGELHVQVEAVGTEVISAHAGHDGMLIHRKPSVKAHQDRTRPGSGILHVIAFDHAPAVGLAHMVDGQPADGHPPAVIQGQYLHEALYHQPRTVSLQGGALMPRQADPHGKGEVRAEHGVLRIIAVAAGNGVVHGLPGQVCGDAVHPRRHQQGGAGVLLCLRQGDGKAFPIVRAGEISQIQLKAHGHPPPGISDGSSLASCDGPP